MVRCCARQQAIRGAVTLIVRGHFYPSRDRPFHMSGVVGGRRLHALVDTY
jgi:hypothetical protein